MSAKVSIISPCYNGEKYISRLLDSLCRQTYKNLEIIIINDGSKDNTENIILSYKEKIKVQGSELIYLRQENQGQSAAINKALPLFTGHYVSFVDSDDYLSDNAIEKKVTYMESHPNVGLLINRCKVLDFDTLKEIGSMERKQPRGKDSLFTDLITGNNVFYTPGGYFWRSSMFRDAMPKPLQIQDPREIGQNFQLIMPIAYKYPIGYIDDYLYYYLVRKGSHSRTMHSYEQSAHIWDIVYKVLTHIADDVEKDTIKRTHIQKLIEFRYNKEQMELAYNYHFRTKYRKYRKGWVKAQVGDNQLKGIILICKNSILRLYYQWKSAVAKTLS